MNQMFMLFAKSYGSVMDCGLFADITITSQDAHNIPIVPVRSNTLQINPVYSLPHSWFLRQINKLYHKATIQINKNNTLRGLPD